MPVHTLQQNKAQDQQNSKAQHIITELMSIADDNSLDNDLKFNKIGTLAEEGLTKLDSQIDDHSRGLLHYYASLAQNHNGNSIEHLMEARAAATYLERTQDTLFLYYSYKECSHASWLLGQYPNTLDFLLRAYDLAKELNDKTEQKRVLNNLGSIYCSLGDYTSAIEQYEQSLELAKELQDDRSIAGSLGNIGVVYHQNQKYDIALEYYQQSLKQNELLGNTEAMLPTISNIGYIYSIMGRFEQSLEMFKRAYGLASEHKLTDSQILLFSDIGGIYLQMGEYEKASQYLNNSYSQISKVASSSSRHLILSQLSSLYAKSDYAGYQPELAITYMKEALDLAVENKESSRVAQYYKSLSEIEKKIGNFKTALDYLHKYVETDAEISTRSSEDRLNALQVRHRVDQLRSEAQIERLRNIDLAEANTRLEELNTEKNTILGIAAHDLKNPLASIKLAADFLLRHADALSPDDIGEFADDLLRSSSYMFAIISNLLDINALESGKIKVDLTECDISGIVRFVTEGYHNRADEKFITLNLHIAENIPNALTDEHRLREVLENLISNAIKFSPNGLAIDISAESLPQNNNLRITVRDHGPGISKNDMAKLFGKFQKLSARPTGGEDSTGLGLSIVKKLIELMKGNVWCESVEGEGAAFIVEIPKA